LPNFLIFQYKRFRNNFYICDMQRLILFLLGLCIMGSAMGFNPGAKSCKMALKTKDKHCPCAPKDGKKKCCQPKLKPQKHLSSGAKHKVALGRILLPFVPFIPPFIFLAPRGPETDTSEAWLEIKPPDNGPPIYLLNLNIRC